MAKSVTRRGPGRAPAGTVDGRSALLRAARVVFAARGYAAATTREILAKSDTTSPTLHHHFGSKAGLYCAVREQVTAEILAEFEAATVGCGTGFTDRLDAIMDASVVINERDPAVSRIVFAAPIESGQNPELAHSAAGSGNMPSFIENLCRTSTGLAVDSSVATRAVMTLIYGLGRSAMTLDVDKYSEVVVALRVLVHGQLTQTAR